MQDLTPVPSDDTQPVWSRFAMTPLALPLALILRWSLSPIVLLGLCGGAHGGADPWPTDWLPQFRRISVEEHDVFFYAGVTQIRLRNGLLDESSGLPINTLVQKQNVFIPRGMACSAPNEVLSRHNNGYKDAEVVYCDPPERIWFATGGYCGEGDDDPLSTQGHLYSYSPHSGKVQKYSGFLPKCAELAGMLRIKKNLLVATVYQEEYSIGAGNILLFDLEHPKAHPKVLTNPHSTGPVVGISDYDRQCDCLWFATSEGIERLTISEGKWEQRYLDYEVTPDNKFVPSLSLHKPSDEKMWLGRMLYSYPIEDPRGFVTAWNQSPPSEYDNPRIGPLLLPFYLAAIERTQEGWTDWSFSGLMGIIEAHRDSESRANIQAFLKKMLKRPLSLSRRKEVISAAKVFGVERAKELENAYFDELLKDYFIRPRASQSYDTDAVRLAFEHPEYLPKIRDYYLTHTITFDVEEHFLDRVLQYNAWPGYNILLPAITEGRKRYERRMQLFNMCMQVNPFHKEGEAIDRSKVLAVLRARQETDEQAKLSNRDSCISASNNLVTYGSAEQSRRWLKLMLDVVYEHKELSKIALEILNTKFSTHFQTIEEWGRWWEIAQVTDVNANGVCSKEMSACINSATGCVSFGVPYLTSKCDGVCQAEAQGKLYAAGVSIHAHPGMPSPQAPLGCVGYRKDLGGTEAGAKCIAEVLGYEYLPTGCNQDGWPYIVRTR